MFLVPQPSQKNSHLDQSTSDWNISCYYLTETECVYFNLLYLTVLLFISVYDHEKTYFRK